MIITLNSDWIEAENETDVEDVHAAEVSLEVGRHSVTKVLLVFSYWSIWKSVHLTQTRLL